VKKAQCPRRKRRVRDYTEKKQASERVKKLKGGKIEIFITNGLAFLG